MGERLDHGRNFSLYLAAFHQLEILCFRIAAPPPLTCQAVKRTAQGHLTFQVHAIMCIHLSRTE
jgi:hypothetical protein